MIKSANTKTENICISKQHLKFTLIAYFHYWVRAIAPAKIVKL